MVLFRFTVYSGTLSWNKRSCIKLLHLLHLLAFMEFVLMCSFESPCLTLLELLSCPELHSILRLVLKAGNYMNAVSHSLFILLSFSSYSQSGIHLFNPSQHTCNTWPGCIWLPHAICTWDSLCKEYAISSLSFSLCVWIFREVMRGTPLVFGFLRCSS